MMRRAGDFCHLLRLNDAVGFAGGSQRCTECARGMALAGQEKQTLHVVWTACEQGGNWVEAADRVGFHTEGFRPGASPVNLS